MPEVPQPLLLATAVEAVMRAGEVQMAHFGTDIRVDKKGVIDLVTEIDIEIERGFRAMIAERFPDHGVLGEEFGSGESGNRIPHFCWVFDPIDGTTNYAHGLPIFCSSLAFEVDGEPVVAAIYDPNRRELFTAERGQGAWLNGAPLRVSAADHAHRFAARDGLSLRRPEGPRVRSWISSPPSSAAPAPCAGWDRPRSTWRMWRRGASTASGNAGSNRGTSRAARSSWPRPAGR